MTEEEPQRRVLHDQASGQAVEVIYAIPPQLISGIGSPLGPDVIMRNVIKRWRIVLTCAALITLLGAMVAISAPNRYTAKATALPPPEREGGAGMLAQYAGIAATAGIQLPGSPASSLDSIMAILASRRLQEPLIKEFNLRERYKAKTRDDAISSFAADFDANSDFKTRTITISVTQDDAERAAQIANAAADSLSAIYNEINQSAAARERKFLEERVRKSEVDSAIAGRALAEFQSKSGAVEIESQARVTIETVASLQGQLMAQQIELRALLASAASLDNPRIIMLQNTMNATNAEIKRLVGINGEKDSVFIGLASLPELSVEYLERFREVKKQEAVFAALTTQLEAARIAEIRIGEIITIVDRAYAPERKSGPPRAQIIFASLIAGLIAGVGLVSLIKLKNSE